MKPYRIVSLWSSLAAVFLGTIALPGLLSAQIAYDDAGAYQLNANWTNGANGGFGFTPWTFATNGPDFHGSFVQTANNPTFVIASITNVSGVNYTNVWGLFANGTNGINESMAYRGFANPLSTNTFKLQWGAIGSGVTSVNGFGQVHGLSGFSLRNGNATNSTSDFQTGAMFFLFFQDGNTPPTLYFQDANGNQSIPNTSFSNLGRNNITNAVEAEITPSADGNTYHLVLKDSVQNLVLFQTNGTFINPGQTIDSAALFCHETTGDQVYNRMQITSPTNIPPTIVNVQPADGSLYLPAGPTDISFEVDSFNATVASSQVTVLLNGVLQSGLTFNTASPTNQLLGTNSVTLDPNTFYTLEIIAQDANGNLATNTSTFNTFLATDLYIDAYDYNYTNGLFVDALTPSNAYSGLLGNQNVDYFLINTNPANNTNVYRSGDLPAVLTLATDNTGDPVDHANLRANGFTAYNIGFTDKGTWENYTRTVPPNNYNIYARAASAGSGQFEIEKLVNSSATTSNQPFAALGRVNVPNTGGSRLFSGQLLPLTDIFGNAAVVPFSGLSTIRCTAISSDGYNLEYLVFVPATSAGTLRPYISTGSPTPNSTGNPLLSPITFTIANRQTTVTPASIQVFLGITNNITTNLTSKLVLSNNAGGTTVTFTPTNNLPANFTNVVTVVYTDSASVSITNTWNFVTSSTGGVNGNGVWSGGGGTDMTWPTAANWTGGIPAPGFSATFATPGSTTSLVTNNIVSTNVTVVQLNYITNANGFHTTLIQDGTTLTVSNNTTSTTALMQVGGVVNGDNLFNTPVTNTIAGLGGTLLLVGNDPRIGGGANGLNLQVRQCASPPRPYQTTLDMSGLGTMIATIGKFYLAQGGSGGFQSNCSARVSLARTNVVTLLRSANAGQFEVGDSSGGLFTLPGSALYLGITNAFFVDTARFGKQKATNNLVAFNPAFTSGLTPVFYFRGTNAHTTDRVTTWTIGDADTENTVPVFSQAVMDFTGGKLDALASTLVLARGSTNPADSGFAIGTLTFGAGTLDVTSLQIGVQRANGTTVQNGSINVNGTGTLQSGNILLAQAAPGANASLVAGSINVTNGTVRGNIAGGGGNSILNLIGGTLVVSNNVGTNGAPLSTLNLASASIHLNANGNATGTNIVATTVTASGTTTIRIDSVANITGPTIIHLLAYTGSDPFANLQLGPLPSGYTGNLVDNPGTVDLSVTVSAAPPPPPTIHNITVSGGQIIISGTNNSGPGGTYHLLGATNITVPLSNWAVVTNSTFDANGNFVSTNAMGTNARQFFILQVP
jgi:hypothetical protein